MSAIGMIDVIGLVNAITIADECLKTANVSLVGIENVSSGIVTVKISGDVGAVTSSVNSAIEKREVLAHSVIANLDNGAKDIFKDSKKHVFKSNSRSNYINENKIVLKDITINADDENENTQVDNNQVNQTQSESITEKDNLELKTVKELVEMIVKLKNFSYKEAKKLKKEELINKLRVNS